MDERDLEAEVAHWLSRKGLAVSSIARSRRRSADLLATDKHDVYLVEIKHRLRFPRDLDSVVASNDARNGLRMWRSGTASQNRFSGLIRDAVKQLDASAAQRADDPMRLIWFQLQPPEDRHHEMRLSATLYGKLVARCEKEGRGWAQECYLADWAEFFRFRDSLDGAIVCGSFGIGLLLNHLGPRFERLKASCLAERLGAVFDPLEFERRGEILLVDPPDSQPSQEHVSSQLRERYGIELKELMELTFFAAEVAVPLSTDDAEADQDL